MRPVQQRTAFRGLALGILLVSFGFLPRKLVELYSRPRIFSPDATPAHGTAIVFGAGLRRDGTPTDVLADRVIVASQLFFEDKVTKILMSGSDSGSGYSEPEAMRNLAISLGVPEDVILQDSGGRRTFDTCLRAKEEFGLKSVLLVSQEFHLPRALAICEALGMDAIGARADLRSYHPRAMRFWKLREFPATIVALWDAFVANAFRPPAPDLQSSEITSGYDYDT